MKFNQNEKVNADAYRPKYHFSAPKGWLNDPNGFGYFNGEWHLFYQHNPRAPRWGRMSWGHAISGDLVNWRHLPIALKPKTFLDNFLGCFSGSAIEHNGKLCLMYTGVPFFKQHQALAYSRGGIKFKKVPTPVIGSEIRPPHSGIFSFRDPKLIKKDDMYYAIIGASYKRGKQIALYKSENLIDWVFISPFFKDETPSRGIFECPDLLLLPDGDCLIYCNMFTKAEDARFQNLHSSVYIIGDADLVAGTFSALSEPREIDFGADFYAPQTAVAEDGRVIMIAWMQMWMRSMPTRYLKHGYAGIMTIPKELRIEGGILYQKPVKELYAYFDMDKIVKETTIKDEVFFKGISGECFRLKIALEEVEDFTVHLRKNGDTETTITYKDGLFTFNRENGGFPITGLDDCNVRYMRTEGEKNITLEIFVDKSSIELIANERYAMSNTVYPYPNCTGITFSSEAGCKANISFSPHITE